MDVSDASSSTIVFAEGTNVGLTAPTASSTPPVSTVVTNPTQTITVIETITIYTSASSNTGQIASTTPAQATSSVPSFTTVEFTTDFPQRTIVVDDSNGNSVTVTISATSFARNTTISLSNTHSKGPSTGVTAGIAVGCAVVGAAIAGLILFAFFRRSRKRNHQPAGAYGQHVGPYPNSSGQEKAPVTTTSAVAAVDSYLPQPAADDALLGEFSRLRDSIKNHVQSYYHTAPVDGTMVDINELQEVARVIGLPAQKLQELILNPQSRIASIRLYLAALILSRCDGRGLAKDTFLPIEVAAFASLIAGMNNTNTSQIALASKWKAVSGTLLQNHYKQQIPTPNDTLEHNIQRTMAEADSVLVPFVGSSVDDKRLKNLESIMRRAAQFAFLLFSQPSSWSFEWVSRAQQGRIAVFPGLLQTVTDEGSLQRPPRLLSEPEAF